MQAKLAAASSWVRQHPPEAGVGVAALVIVVVASVRHWAALAVLTAALVVLTGYYAVQTRRTVGEMRQARLDDMQERKDERDRLVRERSRERCETAVRQVLGAFRDLRVGMDSVVSDDGAKLDKLRQALIDHTFEIRDDPVVVDRLEAASRAIHMFVHRKSDIPDPGYARLRLNQLLCYARWSLEGYLKAEPLRSWTGMPESAVYADNWLNEKDA